MDERNKIKAIKTIRDKKKGTYEVDYDYHYTCLSVEVTYDKSSDLDHTFIDTFLHYDYETKEETR